MNVVKMIPTDISENTLQKDFCNNFNSRVSRTNGDSVYIEGQCNHFPLYRTIEEVPDEIPILEGVRPVRGWGSSRQTIETISKDYFTLQVVSIDSLKNGLKYFN